MRRFIALLILCVLPLQWSYAAMAEYCQHEKVAAEQQHIGHHQHKHVDETAEKLPKNSGFVDMDCPACQHSLAVAVLDTPPAALQLVSSAPELFNSQAIPHRSPDNPFRPPLAARA